ncbi:MAG: hypothetical protein EXS10_04850 [Phycisphaerales bacterium]|nr:hypothetical protein [Phycisphaerales bacterium]
MSHELPPHVTLTDDPEPGMTWFLSLAGTIGFAATVIATCVMFFAMQNSFTQTRVIEELPVESFELANAQKEQIAQYGRFMELGSDDKTTERIHIPIDQAMDILVADAAAKKTVK